MPLVLSSAEEARLARFKGCLLAGAVGDALGAAVEFDSLERIRERFGDSGLRDYALAYGRIGAITDDTQMTLFTAEGLIRSYMRSSERGICNPASVIHRAYLRWLYTQRIHVPNDDRELPDYLTGSWLLDVPDLNVRRAPGNTCLSALRSGEMGTIEEPINNSKGCGGVMRIAPAGLFGIEPFRIGAEAAATTHGHPTGYISAGVLAVIVSKIVEGRSLVDSVNHAVYEVLPNVKNHEETFEALDKAISLAQDRTRTPSPELVETLGGGWVGEEAVAIAIYCSLARENDLTEALLLAVNHSGDTDSTGAITGNILGTLHGVGSIPVHWLERLELRKEIEQIAVDLHAASLGADLWDRYPGW
ncbi:MAG: ADP-ribosylglycohydrolase family protein [Acidobacteria bacterium]|nr:ADP-ribosylglycohydrolase family protein [Acidobacteriota bacterium]